MIQCLCSAGQAYALREVLAFLSFVIKCYKTPFSFTLFLLLLKLFHWVKKNALLRWLCRLLLVGITMFVQHPMYKNSWMLTVVPSLGLFSGMAQEARLCFVSCGWLNLSSSAQPMSINGISDSLFFSSKRHGFPKAGSQAGCQWSQEPKVIMQAKTSGIVDSFEWSWALAKVKVLWVFFLQNFIFYFFSPWLLLWLLHLQIILFCTCHAETLSGLPRDTF